MAGLLTYPKAYQQQSADVGYAILQAGAEGYLTDVTIAAATGADDLIADVNAAVVDAGAESFSQRNSIARALKVGQGLGDLSDARVQAATTVQTLAETTWVTNDPSYLTGHLGPNLLP